MKMTQEWLVQQWRGRVRFWRYFAIPFSVLVLVTSIALAWGMASTSDPFLILLGVFVVVMGAQCVVSAVDGLRFASGVLRTHETDSVSELRRRVSGDGHDG